jgi:flagella basal body P-ring formation protein FlgA
MLTGRFMRLLLLVAFSSSAFAACFPVSGARILGRDLALADSRFSALPANFTAGLAPLAGSSRSFSPAELERIAKSNGITIENPPGICFEIPLRQVPEKDIVQAMRRSLPEITEVVLAELPAGQFPVGEVEFPMEGLEPPAGNGRGAQLWRGHIRYAETRRAPMTVRASITAHYSAVVALRNIEPNVPIQAAALRVESRTGPPTREETAARIEDVAGRAARRSVKAGSIFPVAILLDPPAVRRGDSVTVEVQSGQTQLQFEAIVETAAREGDLVELRNPSTGKTFKARLSSRSRAVLVVGGGKKL